MRSLIDWFLPADADPQEPAARAQCGRRAGLVGIVCNLLLFAGKLAVGILSGSVSVTGDAVNNLSDASASVVTLVGFRLAAKPADPEHPYGHARIEYLSGLAVSAMILLIGADLVKTSVQKILHPERIAVSGVLLAVLAASIAVKLLLAALNRSLGMRIGSASLKAAAADSRNDAVTTAAVLLSCAVSRLWGIRIDGYAGLLVALFILWSGIGIGKDTISPLLGEAPDEELVRAISRAVKAHPEILGIHDLMVHDYGPGRRFASVHAEIDYHMDTLEAHELIDRIEREIKRELHVDIVIHEDPIVTDDPELDACRARVMQIIGRIDPRLSVHDFRLVRGRAHANVIFDMAVPFDLAGKKNELRQTIEDGLQDAGGKTYHAVITFDVQATHPQ